MSGPEHKECVDQPVDADQARLLAKAREVLAPAEYSRLTLLPPRTMATALVRLDRVSSWLASDRGHGGDLPRFVQGLGIGSNRFYSIVRAFDETRSVAALGVAAPRSAGGRFVERRRSKIEAGRRSVEESMRRLLSEHPNATSEQLIAVVDSLGLRTRPSRSALYKWAARLRALASSNLFGSLLIAIVAVDADRDDATQHEVAVVVDRGTSLLVGVALATDHAANEAYRAAMLDGVARLDAMRLPVQAASGPIRLQVAALPDPTVSTVETMRFLATHRPLWHPLDPIMAAREVRDVVGPWLGQFAIEDHVLPWRLEIGGARSLRPQSDQADGSTPRPKTDSVNMIALIARAADAHNRRILEGLGSRREPMRTREMRRRAAGALASMRGEDA